MKKNDFRILLINPPVEAKSIYGEYATIAPRLPPLGLCYLAAVLLKNGYRVEILDGALEDVSFKDVAKKVKNYKPRVIGITSTSSSFFQAKRTITLCKRIWPKVLAVLGGAHISALPEKTMEECPDLDVGVYGEGELTFLELVKQIYKGKNFFGVRGILYRKKGKMLINSPRPPIENLDILPFPARHLLGDLRKYSHTPFRGRKFTLSMITSRGCPFSCSFCDQSVFGKKWRAHSADYVIKEIVCLRNRYGVDFISFEDDNFLLSRKRAVNICRQMMERGINLKWGCSARADHIDRKLLGLMREAGCFNIFIGIESGTPRLLRLIDKKITRQKVKQAVRLIKRAGINVYGSVILGLPSETKKEIEMTIDFICSLSLDGVSVFLYAPYPKTVLAKKALSYGVISQDWGDYSAHSSKLPFVPYGFTESEVMKLQRKAYLKFYTRPSFLFTHPSLFFDYRAWKGGLKIFKNYLLYR